MTDVQKVISAVPSPILVNTDGSTIAGDGSIEHALRAIGGGNDLMPIVVAASPPESGTTALVAGKTTLVDIASGGDQVFDMPPASSVPNGTLLTVIFLNAQVGGSVTYTPSGGDTVHSSSGGHSGFVVPVPYGTITYVSDGASAWWEVF